MVARMEHVVRIPLFVFFVILLGGCAQLNWTASQQGAPIETRPSGEAPTVENGETPSEPVAPMVQSADDVITISPLDTDEVGIPQRIDESSKPDNNLARAAPVKPASSQATEQLLADARNSFVIGDIAGAEAIINRGLRIAPQEPSLWLQLAQIRLGQKSFAEAISLSERAQVLAENDLASQIDALHIIAQAERARGNAKRVGEIEQQVQELKGQLGRH